MAALLLCAEFLHISYVIYNFIPFIQILFPSLYPQTPPHNF